MMWRLFEMFLGFVVERFWGDILVTMKDGRIIHVRVTRQYDEATLPRVTEPHRRVMERADRELLALMTGDEATPKLPPPQLKPERGPQWMR